VAIDEQRPAGRGQALIGAGVAAVLLVVAFVWFAVSHGGGTPKATGDATGTASCVWTPAAPGQGIRTGTPPAHGLPATGTRDVTFATSQGSITITLDLTHAPCGSASLAYLAGTKFFDNSSCHRLTTAGIYILQCGDPTGTGQGGPSYTFEGENYPASTGENYPAGVVAMAIPQKADGSPATDQNGSQFFIVWKDTPFDASSGQSALQSAYTIIGTVTGGMDVVQKVAAAGVVPDASEQPGDGKPKLPVTISSTTVGPVVLASAH